MDWYPWLVFLHIVGAFVFVLSHGVSSWTNMVIGRQRDPARIRALLELSSMSIGGLYIGLLLLLIGGIGAGIMGNWFSRGWIWAALILLVAIVAAMYALASRYYSAVRVAVGLAPNMGPKDAPQPPPATPEELDALLGSGRPNLITVIGLGGLLLILALMVLKPF